MYVHIMYMDGWARGRLGSCHTQDFLRKTEPVYISRERERDTHLSIHIYIFFKLEIL